MTAEIIQFVPRKRSSGFVNPVAEIAVAQIAVALGIIAAMMVGVALLGSRQ